ncbi:hypothetical protein OUZ56_018490 [Daphnia magna]|uniref:Uncharacterized protein n=1 Tax=Daphnia magna TaxID=35525 RepID=A0ABQ9Z8Z6_9CRUS|nr:hypothetical protein OUZ56_018490 [Daphnia magna]
MTTKIVADSELEFAPHPLSFHHTRSERCGVLLYCLQLGLRETVSKGRDRHPYIPVGLSRPSDWLSPSPHPIAPQPLLLVE